MRTGAVAQTLMNTGEEVHQHAVSMVFPNQPYMEFFLLWVFVAQGLRQMALKFQLPSSDSWLQHSVPREEGNPSTYLIELL